MTAYREGTLFLLAVLPITTLWLSRCHALTSPRPPTFRPLRWSVAAPRCALRRPARADDAAETTAAPPAAAEPPADFRARTARLCAARNLPLERVKNARDLASARGSPVVPGRVYRVGRVSDATPADVAVLFGDDRCGIKTLVDLRSPTELRDDGALERGAVFANFTDLVFRERDRLVQELGSAETRLGSRGPRRKRARVMSAVHGARRGTHDVLLGFVDNFLGHDDDGAGEEAGLEGDGDSDECVGCIEAEKLILESKWRRGRHERHFVSIMNELKYVRGTIGKLRKRDVAKTILKSPTTIVSKKARETIKEPFLDEINDGGLTMLNELLLRYGAPGIKYVLDLISDVNRHPVAFYCTAGKDRTGMIAAIILALLGTADDAIVEDYSLSANVYAEMDDHQAMVGALSQRNLNATTFLGAPPEVMEDTLKDIRDTYGSVEEYLDFIGFHEESRKRLVYVLTQ